MENSLARHLTTWRWWYIIPAFAGLVLSTSVVALTAFAQGMSEEARQIVGAAVGLLPPVLFALIGLGAIALLSRRWPTTADLGLRKGLSRRDLVVIAVVFAATHTVFWAAGKLASDGRNQAEALFTDFRLGGPVPAAFLILVGAVILAPVCEEIFYRGTILRSIHDPIARHGRIWLAAAAGIAVSAVAFVLPHLDDMWSVTGAMYLLSGIGFGLVYVLTGSLTAAMVSHSLQSAWSMGQVLLFGSAGHEVSPILYVLVMGCPVWVFLVARALAAVFPGERRHEWTVAAR